ncbi:hypothetical protein BBD41_16840 [Paenibacillus ihbetae]|uniref:Uncharacterized protein n=1 Tax=Paenibacillus ihbetae TaxID=1870820 RepID=A0A1B2E2A0_9BACL|nr:hypothetical protein BBD41_16840 [Paenibacillus ihbetae]
MKKKRSGILEGGLDDEGVRIPRKAVWITKTVYRLYGSSNGCRTFQSGSCTRFVFYEYRAYRSLSITPDQESQLGSKRRCSRAFSQHLKSVYYTKIVMRNPENLITVRVYRFGIWFIVIRRPLRHTEDTRKVKRLH